MQSTETKENSTFVPSEMNSKMAKSNKTSVKLLRCLFAPQGGRFLLNAKFKKIVMNKCTKELLPKTREAALGPRCQLSEMTEMQILDIGKALLADTKEQLDVACQYDESLMSKAKYVLFKPENDGDNDGDVHVPQAHGCGTVNSV